MEKHNHHHACFQIPVKSHVKDYLIKLYGGEPVPTHLNGYLGNMVAMLLDRPHYRLKRKAQPDPNQTYILISVPAKLRHAIFGEEKRRLLGDALNKFFIEQFMAACVFGVKAGWTEQQAVENFFHLYDVNTESWDLEAGRKCWRDNRDKRLLPLIPEWQGSAAFSNGDREKAA